MQNNNKKVFDNMVSKTKIYLIIIFILLFIICLQNIKFVIPSIIIYILVMGYTYFANNKVKYQKQYKI